MIKQEEESFLRTLEKGIELLDKHLSKLKEGNTLDGATAFELYDTFGFPYDLTALMASERGISVDEEGFNKELLAQKERGRSAGKISTDDWVEVHGSESPTEFYGYDNTSGTCRILRYRKVEQKGKASFQVVLDRTPFYPEGGGQIGDTGILVANGEKYGVADTKKENNLIVHTMTKLPENLEAEFTAEVNRGKQLASARNHQQLTYSTKVFAIS